jgi:hypothetical protein
MPQTKPPLGVAVLACLYIATGAIGFVYHFPTFHGGFHHEDFWIELTEVAALISGIFLLRGHNWARWLALAWIAFHILLSAFQSLQASVIHSLLACVFAWILFGRSAAPYFARDQNGTTVS